MGQYILSGLCYNFELDIKGITDEGIERVKNNVSKLIDIGRKSRIGML